MKTKRVKVITVSPESRDSLMAKYGCASTTLYQALRYVTRTERADAIRKDALENFGGRVSHKFMFN